MLDTTGSQCIQTVLDDWVRRGQIVGGVVLLSQNNCIIAEAVAGHCDQESRKAMQRDTVLRYASMTKLVVSVLALKLVGQGVLDLDDPVTRWLPTFRPALANGDVPTITVRHLLSHTAGLSYGFEQRPGNPYEVAGVTDGLDDAGLNLNENLARLASVPLMYPPGTEWRYSIATDVLGAILENVSGRCLDDLVHSELLKPLEITQSGFPGYTANGPEKAYWNTGSHCVQIKGTGWYDVEDRRIRLSENRAVEASAFASAGSGMIGTADDFIHILHVLASGGEPILNSIAARLIYTNAIGDIPLISAGPGWAFGLGARILTDPEAAHQKQGRGTWGWCGIHGSHYWVDPENALAMVALTNTGITGAWGPFADQLVDEIYAD